jgi:copper chaperone NosL
MYQWGYSYGHDLDPRAAIKVEGQAYQPPLIGHKQLLNFDAWSTPDIGGWVLFAVMGLLAGVYFLELRRKRPAKPLIA